MRFLAFGERMTTLELADETSIGFIKRWFQEVDTSSEEASSRDWSYIGHSGAAYRDARAAFARSLDRMAREYGLRPDLLRDHIWTRCLSPDGLSIPVEAYLRDLGDGLEDRRDASP